MSTVTMELPDKVAEFLTTPEGMERARRAVLEAYEEMRPAQGEDMEDLAAGRTQTREEQDARLKAKFPWLKASADSGA